MTALKSQRQNRPSGAALHREISAYLARTGMRQRDLAQASGVAELTISALPIVAYVERSAADITADDTNTRNVPAGVVAPNAFTSYRSVACGSWPRSISTGLAMTDRPIIFSAPMVRALRNGGKT